MKQTFMIRLGMAASGLVARANVEGGPCSPNEGCK